MNIKKWFKIGFLSGFILSLLSVSLVFAADRSKTINIGFTVNPICGNGVVESGEACDDGNLVSGDGCNSSCQTESCFLSGTKIIINNGIEQNIESVKVNDKVLSFDEVSGINRLARVTHVFSHEVGNYLVLNNDLKVTSNHPFYINKKWVEIGEARLGDMLVDKNGDYIEIWSIQSVEDSVRVYNLEVDNFHNYYAGNVLVHNKVPSSYPVVSSFAATTTYTTADLSWKVTDNYGSFGVYNVVFEYGLTTNYGLNSNVITVSPPDYLLNLSSLATNTLYYFKITASDDSGGVGRYTSSFQTKEYVITPPDTTSPIISGIQVIAGTTTAQILWNTDEDATGQISYGLTNFYGSTATHSTLTLSHNFLLVGLLPSTTYHYKLISADKFSNTTSTNDRIFTTLRDVIAPPNVSNLTVVQSNNDLLVSWDNTPLLTVPDFVGIKLLRKTTGCSTNKTDGILVYTGSGTSYLNSGVASNTLYYYTAFSYDTSGNYSTGACASGKVTPQLEICDNTVDDDGDTFVDCDDPDCADECVADVYGCTDSNANNYDVLATADDGSCTYDPGVENCSNGIDDDGDTLVDCDDPDCDACVVDVYGCTDSSATNYNALATVDNGSCTYPPGSDPEICDNGLDDDGDTFVDCYDSECRYFISCIDEVYGCADSSATNYNVLVTIDDGSCTYPPGSFSEICDNGLDDDGDTLVDCRDPDCSGFASCSGSGGDPECSDGIDNDNDSLIDYPDDPGCLSLDDDNEYSPTIGGQSTSTYKLYIGDLFFRVGNGNINLEPSQNTITGLSGFVLRVGVWNDSLPTSTNSVVLRVGGSAQNILVDSGQGYYYTDIVFPPIGIKDSYLEVTYEDNKFDFVEFKINSLSWGRVNDKEDLSLSGVSISLLDENKNEVNLSLFGQLNPMSSDRNGTYAWMVKNGRYQLAAEKDGYYKRTFPELPTINNSINREIQLVKKPDKIVDVIDPDAGVGENIVNIAENLLEKQELQQILQYKLSKTLVKWQMIQKWNKLPEE